MPTFLLLKWNFVIFHYINLLFVLTLLPRGWLFRYRYYTLKWIECFPFCLLNKILWFLSDRATKYTVLIMLWNWWSTHWHSFCLLSYLLFSFLLYFFVSQCLYIFFHFFKSFFWKIYFRIPSCLNYSIAYYILINTIFTHFL
jgi:hypothetical protein